MPHPPVAKLVVHRCGFPDALQPFLFSQAPRALSSKGFCLCRSLKIEPEVPKPQRYLYTHGAAAGSVQAAWPLLPAPYNRDQEIYFEFLPIRDYVDSGIWTIELLPEKVVTGRYDFWLPVAEATGGRSRFLYPDENVTLTVPSTANKVITVSAYDSALNGIAYFSGRGFTRRNQIKPDLCAPGVNIRSASPGGGYSVRSGTSMATPFVSGSSALLMQYGIIEGRDPYLYGEKIKAYLIRGAKQFPIFEEYPNQVLGYGALCLFDSMP